MSNPRLARKLPAIAASLALAAGSFAAQAPQAHAKLNSEIGYPTFAGDANPVPAPPVDYTPGNMLQSIFAADVAAGAGADPATDFWIDKMLARTGTAGDSNSGNSDQNRWLFSRGRTVFMKTHNPGSVGFGGDVAYIESINGSGAFTVAAAVGGTTVNLTEVTAQRRQTPSYWRSVHANAAAGISVTQTKFITDANVAVVILEVTNTGAASVDVTLKATAPHATTVEGDELTGSVKSFNNLTLIRPRFSGDGFTAADGALTRTLTIAAGAKATTKLQEGFTTAEITDSRSAYDAIRGATPAAAYTEHVTAYNRWWAENVPYVEIADKNIEKSLWYRWWLMRYNFLDADIPGNDYQFPTAMEGVLGYNNAIVLTSGMFIDDLKYFRDPSWSYGTWVSAGEVAKSAKFVDNPGDPANWNNSYTQYITEAGWRAYQLHGGPASIAENMGVYGENDVKGVLAAYDGNKNKLLEYNWGAMTGNDADAVSFDWRPGAMMDRTESAYLYSNAKAAAAAYRTAGDTANAAEMEQLATDVQQAVLTNLWDPTSKLLLHRIAAGDRAYVPWKEINNYYPFSVGLMPKPDGTPENDQYLEALRLWADADQYPIFPFFTANQADKALAAAAGHVGSNNFSIINSTVTFRFLSRVLREYPNSYITSDYYKKLLSWNAWAHYQSGDNRYPDQNEFWADGSADPQRIGYRSWIHHTILGTTNFTVIEDVAGLRPRDDAKVELDPIDIGWDHFTVNNVRYRDRDLTIVWDKPGDGTVHYAGVPEGYSIYLDGVRRVTVDSLKQVVFDPATGDVELPDGGAVTGATSTVSLQSPVDVRFASEERIVDLFAKAGRDLVSGDGNLPNLAEGATATASFSATNRGPAGAVDGTTINEPFWGTAGSPNASDTIDLDLGSAKAIDTVRVHFYRTSTTATAAGYAAPAAYQVSYWDGSAWQVVPGQLRTPSAPSANLNEARFAPVTTSKLRVTVLHAAGAKTGVKEVIATSTGRTTTAPGNQAPTVSAYVDSTASAPGSATLVGTVGDDGLPSLSLTSRWSVVSAPEGGTALFTDPTKATTEAKFTVAGTYVLRLTATDGALSSYHDLTVQGTVASGTSGGNAALSCTPSASYTAGWNNVNAINDGAAANTGGAQTALWGTWSGSRPATQWLQCTWPSAVRLNGSEITFWHDSPPHSGDGVAVPEGWKIQYRAADGTWVDVANPSEYGVKETGSNVTMFDAVTTTAVRATFNASTNGSSYAAMGVSEWKIFADAPVSTEAVHVPTLKDVIPTLPATVEQVYADGSRADATVIWPEITAEQVAVAGTSFTVTGIVASGGFATATVWVRVTDAVQINVVEPVSVRTYVGRAPVLPETVTALYNDGSKDSGIAVTWAAIEPASYAAVGQFEVSGTVAGTDKLATATVSVVPEDPGPDVTGPTVSLTLDPATPDGTAGWYVTAVAATVTATDDQDPAPVREAQVNGGVWTTVTGPVTLDKPGTNTIVVRATDAAGNVSEKTAQATVKVDLSDPVTSAIFDEATRSLTLRGADATSGLATLEYRFGDGEWTVWTAAVEVPADVTVVEFRGVDKAGNVEAADQVATGAGPVSPSPTATVTVPGSPSATATVTATPKPVVPTQYNTPGFHSINGRWWYTDCEPYSATIRCRTQIWATTVKQVNGAFVQTTGWVFNNLTYLPYMTKEQWGSSHLANAGEYTIGGRQWRTECGTPATGASACRSYLWASYIASEKLPTGGYRYYWTQSWVLNNIVLFRTY